jgi:phenylalanyl-tRNA synthetase alpha subunit
MALNEGYRTLRDRRSRLEYLLALESPNRAENRSNRVPVELFDVVEQVHELLCDYRTASNDERPAIAAKLRALRQDASAAMDGLWQSVASVGDAWDANENAYELAEISEDVYQTRKKPLLERLERLSDELAYAARVVTNIDRALDGERDARVEHDTPQEP